MRIFRIALAMVGFGCSPVWAQVAAEPVVSLRIEAQPLNEALSQLAQQYGLQLVLYSDVGRGLIAPELIGEFTPRDALARMLANTGLRYEFLDKQTVAILSADQTTSAPTEILLDEVIVRADHLTHTATKMDAPVLEVSQNIQVLSAKLMDDIGASLLEDALRHVAGVQPGGFFNGWDYFRIRGFDAATAGSLFLDGLRVGDLEQTNSELFGLEQVEVLKGPSSTLYGDGLLSGMVNMVSKRPKPGRSMEVEASVGSHNFYDANLDLNGPLLKSSNVNGRLVTVFRNGGSFVDHVDGIDRLYVAPSVSWNISDHTQLTVLANYTDNQNEVGVPLPGWGTVLPNSNGRIPQDRFIGDPETPGSINDVDKSVTVEFTHALNENLSFRQIARGRWNRNEFDRMVYADYGTVFSDDYRLLERWAYFQKGDGSNYASDSSMNLRFNTGRFRHNLIVGFDFSLAESNYLSSYEFGSLPALDLYDPAPGGFPVNVVADVPVFQRNRSMALYLQNRIDLTDRLILSLGGRWDYTKGARSDNPVITRSEYDGGHAFVPTVGLNFQIVPSLYAYASFSESFNGQFDALIYNPANPPPPDDPLTPENESEDPSYGLRADPEKGRQIEIGLKSGMFDNRLNATVAVYDLTKSNVLQQSPLGPQSSFQSLTGEQRSRGFEIDSQLIVMPGWEVLFSYAYTDAEVTKDEFLPVGSKLLNVPHNSGSLWSRYTVQSGPLQKLSLSIGGSIYSRQAGKNYDPTEGAVLPTFDLPAYTLVNAAVSYERGNARYQLNLRNLTNERYFVGSYDELYVLPGDPRSIRFTAGWMF